MTRIISTYACLAGRGIRAYRGKARYCIVFVNISELVLEGIRSLAGVFRAAEAWDLKRTALRQMPGLQTSVGPNRIMPPAFCENKIFENWNSL